MKYVMFHDDVGGRHPVLFHDHLIHKLVADGIRYTYRASGRTMTPVSAGFYNEEAVEVHGRSESLNMDSDPDDAMYIFLGGAVTYTPPDMVRETMKMLKQLEVTYVADKESKSKRFGG